MEENGTREGKDLALDEKKADEIAKKIEEAILNDKKEIIIGDGISIIPVRILNNQEDNEKYDIEFGGTKIATVKKGEKIPSDAIKKQMERYADSFNFDNVGRTPTENEKADSESLKLEAELNKAIAEGRAEELRMGREITAAGEDLSIMLKRMFGDRVEKGYRVREKNDSHKFKYIALGNDGKYFEPRGSRANEGTNSRQMCWVLNRDGSFVRKAVDDMKVFGKYAIATDIADNVLSDDTKTLVGQRTPRGEYILIPALDYRIGDTSSNSFIKDTLSRGNSIWEIDEVILAANLGQTIRGTKKDGRLSAEEVEFILKLKREGVADDKVKKIVDALLIVGELKDQGLKDTSIKAILDTVNSTAEQLDELQKANFSKEEIGEVMKLVHQGEMKFNDAKRMIERNREDKTRKRGEKTRGERPEGHERPEGPWDK